MERFSRVYHNKISFSVNNSKKTYFIGNYSKLDYFGGM